MDRIPGPVVRFPDHPTLIRRMLDSRLEQLAATPPVLAVSLNTYTHRCRRPACPCHHGGPRHTGQHLTLKAPETRPAPSTSPRNQSDGNRCANLCWSVGVSTMA